MKPKSQSSADETPSELQPTHVIFRSPIPGGETLTAASEEVTRGDGRWAGGFFFTEPETRARVWVPDSNVVGVKFE